MTRKEKEPGTDAALDACDRRLLNRVQTDFPLTARPFRDLGEETGLTEKKVLARLDRLRSSGVVRRIGANFFPKKIGYVSTLCAARVPEHKIDAFAAVVNRLPGVTHNYLREDEYNIWFTMIEPSMERIETRLEEIRRETGVPEILNLPAVRLFKIRARFSL